MNICIHTNEGERQKEEHREGKWQRGWRKRARGRVPQSCLALVAWAKECCPSISYLFPPPCVWVSSFGSCHPAPAGPAGLITGQFPWALASLPLASLRAAFKAGLPPWVVLDGSSCPRLHRSSKPAAGAHTPFSRGVLFSEENMRTRRQLSIPPLDVGE